MALVSARLLALNRGTHPFTAGSSGFHGICVHEASFKDMPGMGVMKQLSFMVVSMLAWLVEGLPVSQSQSKLVQQALHPSRVGRVLQEPGATVQDNNNNKQRLQT